MSWDKVDVTIVTMVLVVFQTLRCLASLRSCVPDAAILSVINTCLR